MPDSPSPLTPRTPDEKTAVGLIAGRYEVISVIGEGSSARTLLCADVTANRRVVLKELHLARLADWKFLELFEREARMLGRLEHPGIPKIFDYFQNRETVTSFYIVQEYIEGLSLLERMESGPMLGQRETREIALGLLDVLDYLHGRAPPVVHRDIKPANVLLRADGTPVLIDFGGVRATWQHQGVAAPTVVGTFGYMAPEQFAGQGGALSDLYSLGATLLHLVTGSPPSDFPFDTGRIEVPADLPTDPGMAGLIEALLRPAPRDRPPSAAAAREMLLNPPARKGAELRAGALPNTFLVTTAEAPPRSFFGVGGEPRFVDPGAPVRDPRGEFSDVYRNLMHPFFPARRPWSDSEHALWVGVAGVTSLLTLGGAPAVYALLTRRRRKQYDRLFRNGVLAVGTIVSIPESPVMQMMIKYRFEVGGAPYRGFMNYPQEVARYWNVADQVAVLHDPDDPGISCLVYR